MQKSDLKIIIRTEIDTEKWNKCIESSSNLVYPHSWYLDIVSPNWKAIIYKDYEAVFPLTWRKKYGITYLFQPFFTQQLGLYCIDNASYRELYPFIFKLIKSTYKHINIHLNHHFTRELIQLNNFELPLKHSIEKHLKYYSTQTKRNLKKATKNKLSVHQNIDPKLIINLFKNTKGTEVRELKQDDYTTLNDICTSVKKNASLLTIGVYSNKELVSGALFLNTKNRLTMILLASNSTGRKTGASTLLLHDTISENCNSNYVLDFEGSQIESLAKFYQGFGALNRIFGTLKHSIIPFKS